MAIVDEPKIDCHCHILDPQRFPYAPDTHYRPAGQEVATAAQMRHLFAAHGVRNALLVQPNSGYGVDNRCMLDAIATSGGRFKGVAVVSQDVSLEELSRLRDQDIVGVAFNMPLYGVEHYLGAERLVEKLVELDMFLQLQFHEAQFLDILPLVRDSPVRLLIDHCGRPAPKLGVKQPAFQTLLDLGRSGRASVKLSGYSKLSDQSHPFRDAWPFIHALADAFTLDQCMWASDWPFLRAAERVDYGPLLTLVETLFPEAADRRKLLWETPCRLFGFDPAETQPTGFG